jgi:Coenzyme PQQ synthesis protein D (PqqD)
MSTRARDRWCRRADVLERRLPTGVLLLPVVGDDVTLLAGTGGRLWSLLTEPRTTGELTAELARHYAGDANTIRTDVEAVVAELERGGLVGTEA